MDLASTRQNRKKSLSTNPYLMAFENDAHDIQQAQQKVLSQIVESLALSDYGQHLSVSKSMLAAQFVRAVPLVSYEDLRPWIDQIESAESRSLTSDRTVAFFRTSGSMAEPKKIPVTATMMRQKVAAFSIFWGFVYRDYPEVASGTLVSNFIDTGESSRLDSGLEFCSESSFWSRRGRVVHSLQRWPLPASLRLVSDLQARLYAIARLLLQSPLHCIMCLNPSTLLQFCRVVDANAPALVHGLQTGTWGTNNQHILQSLDVGTSQSLNACLNLDLAAAQRLEQARSQGQPVRLGNLWPMLKLVVCWRSAIVQPYFAQLAPYLDTLPVRDYISQSSECVMAIPYRDECSGGALAYTSHFFEFIRECDVSDEQPQTLFAWQLEKAARYELVVTTGGGLYRYRTGDCVQVNDYFQSVPVVEFLYRFGKTSSITGEKLTEHHVLLAAKAATERTGYQPAEFLCFPCSAAVPHYALLVDSGEIYHGLSDCMDSDKRWMQAFEKSLQEINSEYHDKCSSGRLGAMKLYRVEKDALSSARARNKAALVSDEQVKSEVLSSALDIHADIASAKHVA